MKYLLIIPILLLIFSCNRAKENAKTIINKSGEVVGKSAGEFVEGVSEGVEKTLERELIISPKLKDQGIETGKVLIENDSVGNSNNVLTVYVIFNKNFKGKLMAKVEDKEGKEAGRSSKEVVAKAGDAKYIDFTFDPRTHIDVKSKITVD